MVTFAMVSKFLKRVTVLAIRRAKDDPEPSPTARECAAAQAEINFNVATGRALLAARQRQHIMKRIYDLCGISCAHFDAVYIPCAEEFAAYVQSLPASERHHHARAEGLLDHALDTAVSALRLRQAFLLPPDSEPEVVRQRGDLWTFGVFLAALFHDVGKAATDHEVELLDENGETLGAWPALAGPMTAPFYRAKFREKRRYTDHITLGAVVMRPLLPKAALDWLFSDTDLTVQLIEFLSGETKGVLAQIVREADRGSVREDVAADPSPIVDDAQSLPARLLAAFRELLDDGRLPINKPGAAAWVTETDVWLVSKRALDTARDQIRMVSGFVIPKDNQVCMNELQAAQICLATDDDKAIWRAEVRDGDWAKTLSFLRIPKEKIWPDGGGAPAAFSGEIEMPEPSEKKNSKTSPSDDAQPSLPDPPDCNVDKEAISEVELEEAAKKLGPAPTQDEPKPSPAQKDAQEPHGFYDWVRDGIASGKLAINVRNAPLHVVKEGLFMVSPRIFKWYTENDGRWKRIQRKVIQDRVVLKTAAGTNIVEYAVEGERRASALSGMVICDPEAVFGMAMPPKKNELFQRVTPCQGLD